MEEGAKKRLVGAAVVVALLVIFLPMFLEEDTRTPVSEPEMSIPPRPDIDRGREDTLSTAPVEPPESPFPEQAEPISRKSPPPQELAPPPLFDAPATAEPEIESEPEATPDFELMPEPEPATEPPAESATASVKESRPAHEPKPAPKPPSVSKPSPAPAASAKPAPTGSSSWIIQVASLQERKHAYALVQKLRAKGFPAYIQEAHVKQKLWHRVRVGPEKDRKQVESMAASIKDLTGLNGQIQRFP